MLFLMYFWLQTYHKFCSIRVHRLIKQLCIFLFQQKRQIFREQVLPHAGGKIPEDAFRSDRLALNRLNKEGIAVPDGILFEARHHDSHHNSHRHDPDISASIIKLIQTPDGRYAPPEGHYPFDNLIDSTYIIRQPFGAVHSVQVPPHKAIHSTLRIPARPFFPSEDELLNLSNQIESFYTAEIPGTRVSSLNIRYSSSLVKVYIL